MNFDFLIELFILFSRCKVCHTMSGSEPEKDIETLIQVYKSACETVNREPIRKVIHFLNLIDKENEPSIDGYNLDLSGNLPEFKTKRLDQDDAIALARELSEDFLITDINLSYNNIGNTGAIAIGKALQDNKFLEKLNVSMCDIEAKGAEAICTGIQMNDNLRALSLKGNKIGRQGGILLSATLQVNSSLTELDISDTDQTNESLIALTTVLLDNTTVKTLDVSNPLLTSEQEETTIHFAKMLHVNYSLTELHLSKHGMKDFGATQLAESLKDNKTLKYLNLACNKISEDGTRAFASLLKLNTPLKKLSFASNRIGNNGLAALSEAIATNNCNLTTLWINNNGITETGLCALAAALRSNITLSNIYIWGNELKNTACNAFEQLMEGNKPRLHQHNTDVVPYIVDGVTYLAETGHYLFSH